MPGSQFAGSFADEELRESHSDLLYQISFQDGRNGFVFVLFEHKSAPDPLTPLQLLRYKVRIWERQLREKTVLSPIIPLILYHGETPWTTSRTMQDILKAPPEIICCVPQFQSQLIDLSQYSDSELKEKVLFNAALIVLKYIQSKELPARLARIVQLFAQLTGEPRGLECLQAALVYLSNATDQINRKQLIEVVRNTLDEQEESLMPTIAEEWIQEGLEKGLEQGLEQGLDQGLEKGLEQGLEKGLGKGLRSGIRAILELRFPKHSQTIVEQTARLHSAEKLTSLLEFCKTAAIPADLIAFIDQSSNDEDASTSH